MIVLVCIVIVDDHNSESTSHRIHDDYMFILVTLHFSFINPLSISEKLKQTVPENDHSNHKLLFSSTHLHHHPPIQIKVSSFFPFPVSDLTPICKVPLFKLVTFIQFLKSGSLVLCVRVFVLYKSKAF
ncbi:hypothetical protein RJT34_17198 [Clitoria ternatea]|uniref:Uncharacterized protein n=1 Tax=Clitoria ternatea TaxID=43366 RepID=A0AAN9J8I4_CLITE